MQAFILQNIKYENGLLNYVIPEMTGPISTALYRTSLRGDTRAVTMVTKKCCDFWGSPGSANVLADFTYIDFSTSDLPLYVHCHNKLCIYAVHRLCHIVYIGFAT